ncbi:methyl-accepting chemotaxis protein [Candidatus Parabeggiatoa sp. HSG14]|uniref:methyl-accepting chemotaxis protein n=1 Tax=Candidatus Parabeggiatoa sp. HSG14 TaxID=3055593 RepID=UPI0025A8EB6B|nr:methyl-accepting chemotaxis protein [Thiotrichales bacterium HSG14]
MSLKQKIFIPLLFAILVSGTLSYVMINIELTKLENQLYKDFLVNQKIQIATLIDFTSERAIEKAALFAKLPVVIEAFELAHRGNINRETDPNGQKARQMLRQALKDNLESYVAITGEQLKLHFHLPNAHSLLRIWREKQTKRNGKWIDISDDVSSFRNAILEVNKSGKPLKGIELGKGGVAIRGFVPIKSKNKQLGSVEVLMDFSALLENIVKNNQFEKQNLFLFMNVEHLSITTNLRDAKKYPIINEKYVYVYGTNKKNRENLIDIALLEQGKKKLKIIQKNGIILGTFPVKDYKGQQLGVMAYTFEASHKSVIHNMLFSLVGSLAVIMILLGIIVFLIILKSLLIPIYEVAHFAHKVKAGNTKVTLEIKGNDEIGQMGAALNRMVIAQRKVVEHIQRSGIKVTSSATELTATAKQQKNTMSSQVESTTHVENAVEEISKVAAELVESMQTVANKLTETIDFANSGQTDLQQMESAMHGMENASKSISRRLNAINEKAENITSVVTTITKVADQTNLLSLNAAIEAEKAGEYGRGFNVVAQEIRRLADQTALATLDIEQMVKEMQSAVAAGVMEMDKFITEVRRSTENIGNISTQLAHIIEQVQALSPRFEEVNVAMNHQSQNAQHINNAIADVGEGMRQTADSLTESCHAIDQLNEAARELQDEVLQFKV